MARGSRTPPVGGKVKFRFIEFELDGSDAALAESLQSIARAMLSGAKPLTSKSVAPRLTNEAATLTDTEEQLESDIEEESEVPSPNRPRRAASPERVQVLGDIRLDDVKPTLAQFLGEKNPEGDNQRYLAIAYWFKNHKAIEAITKDHIHTAYRHMGWHTPKAASQPLRDMKSKQQWFGKGPNKSEYVINHIGENEINKLGSAKR